MKKIAIIRCKEILSAYEDYYDVMWFPLFKETDFAEVDDKTYKELREGIRWLGDCKLIELVDPQEAIKDVQGALKKIKEREEKYIKENEKREKEREEKRLKRLQKKQTKSEAEEKKLLEELKQKYEKDA